MNTVGEPYGSMSRETRLQSKQNKNDPRRILNIKTRKNKQTNRQDKPRSNTVGKR